MLGVIHVDHRAKKLVEFLREIDDVRTLAAAKKLRVAAHMPDVVVTSEGAITAAGRKW